MKNRFLRKIVYIGILLIVLASLFGLFIVNKSNIVNRYIIFRHTLRSAQAEDVEGVNLEVENYTQMILLAGKLTLSVDSSRSGYLNVILIDSEGGIFIQPYRGFHRITSSDINRLIEIPINPQIYVLPGVYELNLRIYYHESESSTAEGQILNTNIDVNIGLGIPILIILLFILGISTALILTKKEIPKEEMPQPTPQIPSGLEAPQGKIKCPECKKTIDEGLTFCPECGIRIPEFLRYNPDTQTTL